MLHHLDQKISIQKALSEAVRVCKKLLIIEEVCNDKTDIQKAWIIDKKNNKLLHPHSKFRFTKYYTNDELNTVLKELHCKVISKKLYLGKKEHELDMYLYVVSEKTFSKN